MGRVMYEYDNKYMLTATVRSDASSRLAEGHKWHTYPAVSVGWNLMNESFMQDAKRCYGYAEDQGGLRANIQPGGRCL